ncbi:helix-turn-helix protein [Kineococcus xinjiangensis]|uniref:Helix-turn-helix protein n=1 Tax=Kineococcus xinjiangensis TaxID=512762 RepID=A0A2S6IEI2_9ACTN|nr:helix-turn-helix transcriptional regulator [Kineococcus xinjiangensis]PPK92628.1 helix-turn-helix protein [Kineococcus xinjiangensis]
MGREHAVRDFLRARRAAVSPGDVGLPHAPGARRVPGLRREEVASLAGVSVDYYTRLEQGRALNVSDSVLRAIARALRLDEEEVAHLRDLVGPSAGAPRASGRATQGIRPGVAQLLATMESLPAYVLGWRGEVLAANRLARALFTDFEAMPAPQRNLVRWLCTDPTARELFLDWEDVAADAVAALHRQVGKDACDPLIAALVGELSVVSEEFARWWASQRVFSRTHGVRRLRHPLVGRLDLAVEHLLVPGPLEQALVVHSAEPGSASAEALGLLASWTAPGRGATPQEAERGSRLEG